MEETARQSARSWIGWSVVAVLAAAGWLLQRGPAEPPARLRMTSGMVTSEASEPAPASDEAATFPSSPSKTRDPAPP